MNGSVSLPTRVGIVGAGGAVGRVVIGTLAEAGIDCIAAGRRVPVLPDLSPAASTHVATEILDVFDGPALAAFVSLCSLVINCAGPSRLIGDRIAVACLDARTDYLDPGGYDPMVASLSARHDEAQTRGCRLVANAGLLPGLSGIFPEFLIGRYFDRVTHLNCVYVGTDRWTLASADDIICSLGDFGTERPASRLSAGVLERVPLRRSFSKRHLGAEFGTVRTALIYTDELASIARRRAVPNVAGWGGNHGPLSGAVLAAAKVARLHRGQRRSRWAARALCWASEHDAKTLPPQFMIDCAIDGKVGSSSRQVRGRLTVADTYRATGEITALAARFMIEREVVPGFWMLHEAVPHDRFMARLQELGYRWAVDFSNAEGAQHATACQ